MSKGGAFGINPLCRFGTILAIIPPYDYLNKENTNKKCSRFRLYASTFFLIIVVGSGLSIWGRFKFAYKNFPSYTLVTTDMVLGLSMFATNVFSILAPSFWKCGSFKMFVQIFSETDKCLFKDQDSKIKLWKSFYINMILGHLILIGIFIYDGHVWITGLGFPIYRNYIFRDFQSYHVYIMVMTVYNFALSMMYRFRGINNALEEITRCLPIDGDKATKLKVTQDKLDFQESVRSLAQVYETQLLQITLFNQVFGWQILFLMLSVMMGLLNALDMLTVFIFIKNGQGSFEKTFGIDLIILSTLWAVWQLMLGIIITASCTKAVKEAQRTSDVCFNILLKLPVISNNKVENALRDELTMLSQLSVYRCPSFSAAGFFTVDYHLLLTIFGSVTSYVIVLIQFNK